MAKLPAPDWLALALARECALAAFPDTDPEEVMAALLRAFTDGKVAVRARCRQWFEHTSQVEIGPHVWAAGAVDVEWEADRFTVWHERVPHTFTNADARRVDLEKWLGAALTPADKFDGHRHTLIDAAAKRIMDRIGCPTGPALSMLLEAFRSGEIRTWIKQQPNGPYKLSAGNWVGADVDLQEFQSLGHSGLRLGRHTYHLHYVLISADDLQYWLNQKALASPTGQASAVSGALQTVVPTPPGRVRFDEVRAMSLLAAEKVNGKWREAPTERESRTFLLLHFTGVPNDPHRRIRRELWPGNRPGPRRKRTAAE